MISPYPTTPGEAPSKHPPRKDDEPPMQPIHPAIPDEPLHAPIPAEPVEPPIEDPPNRDATRGVAQRPFCRALRDAY